MSYRLTIIVSLFLLFLPAAGLPSGDVASVVIAEDPESFNVSALEGQVVYLDFWASWCEPCQKSFAWLNSLQERYADRGLVVIAVNLDRERANAERFLEKHPVDFRVVYDPQAILARRYDLEGMPSSFLFGKDGELRKEQVGYREKDAAKLERLIELLVEEGSVTE